MDLEERSGETIEVLDHGVDGSGALIEGALANANPDKIFRSSSGKEMVVEVKTAPPHLKAFLTFKVSSLVSCQKSGAFVFVPRRDGYFLFGKTSVAYMLDSYVQKVYQAFSPNDMAIRIPRADLEAMYRENRLTYRRWMPCAVEHISYHWEILFGKGGRDG